MTTKQMYAMQLAQNDLQVRDCFNGISTNRWNYLIKYLCNKYSKVDLVCLYNDMQARYNGIDEYNKMNGLTFKPTVDMHIVPTWFSDTL